MAGALGLVLPGLFRIRRELTPLAAAALTVIMVGAVVVTIATGPTAAAAIPFVVGLLTSFVSHRHWRAARNAPSYASPDLAAA